jgi:hypothetical protein
MQTDERVKFLATEDSWAAGASQTPVRPSRPRPFDPGAYARDALSVIILAVVALRVFFRVAPLLAYADDSWTASYMLFRGTLPLVNLDISDAVAMPYQDRRWLYEVPYHLARFLGTGDVTSYYVFLYACHALTAIVVYIVARQLLRGAAHWGLVAALLVLVYPADYDIFSSAILPSMGWGELMMLVAILCLVLLLGNGSWPRPVRLAVFTLMFAAVLFPVGTYEAMWLLVALAPPLLVLAVALRDHRPWGSLGSWAKYPTLVWYAGALVSAGAFGARLALSPTLRDNADGYVSGREPAIWFGRVVRGSAAALSGVVDVSFRHLVNWIGAGFGRTPAVDYAPWASGAALVPLVGAAVAVILLLRWGQSKGIGIAGPGLAGRVVLAAGVGLLLVVAALLAPTLSGEASFGTRYLHFASYGAVILVVSLGIAAERVSHQPALVAAAVGFLIVACGFYLDSVGTYYGEVGRQSRRFFYQLHDEVPSVRDGTIVLIQDAPTSGSLYEHVTTEVLRAFTGSHTAYLLTDGAVKIDDDPSHSFVRLTTCSDLDSGPNPALERGYWAMSPCVIDPTNPLSGSHVSEIARDRIVWLRWDRTKLTLQLDEQRSAMARVNRDAHSEFGSLLFPDQPPATP